MADLVAEVPEHGAVGLVELLAHPLAVDVVGLGQVERDDAVGVAGHRAVGEVEDRPGSDGHRPSSPSSNSSRRLAVSASA